MNSATLISDAAGVATAAGVLFAGAQLFLSRSERQTSFEDELSGEYRRLVHQNLAPALMQAVPDEEERAPLITYYEYFDLCNEQVLLRLYGRIRRKAWEEWVVGIHSNLTRPPIAHSWEVARDALAEFAELRLLEEKGYTDPRGWNPTWRRLIRRELSAEALAETERV